MSFRKKSTDDEVSSEESVKRVTPVDPIGSDLSNEAWLAGVERRDAVPEAAPQAHDPAYDYPVADEATGAPVPAIDAQYEAAAEQLAEVQDFPIQTPASMPAVSPTAPALGGPAYPDMGIAYAGLETEGVTAFPSEAPASLQPAPVAEVVSHPTFSIEHGPIGSEAAELLTTLGLSTGCSWDDVSSTRRAILNAIPQTGAPEEQQARAAVNHATASLRLLRVGPLSA